jgi:hypothetical protein
MAMHDTIPRVFRPLVVSCCAAVLLALAVANTKTQTRSPTGTASRLIGTWQLVSYESSDTESQRYRGPKPVGLLYYDLTGHMAVQISPDRQRRRFTGPQAGIFTGPQPTPDEALDALSGYAAYFGTYTVDEGARTVTHKRVGNINPGGVGDFVRRYEFLTADRILLVPVERTDLRAVRLTWERLK